MKYLVLIISFIIIICNNFLFAQQEVVKSDKIEVINNKKYYIHEIKKGETLYSISKAYGVEQNDIALENPEVFESFNPGQTIKIPIVSSVSSVQNTNVNHIVKKGETLYSISKKYNISIDELVKNNPDIKNGIQIGQNIIIRNSVKTNTNVDLTKKDTANYYYYKIEKGQTIYSISKKYNISIDNIYKFNPEIEKNGLKNGDIVLVPKNKVEKNNNDEMLIEVKTDTIDKSTHTHYVEPVKNVNCDNFKYDKTKQKFKVSLLLPLQSDAVTIDNEDEVSATNPNFYPQPKPFLEYYEGFLMAVDSIRKSGLNVEIQLIDLKKDSVKTANIINDGSLSNSDLIIGPVYEKNFMQIAKYAKNNSINAVYPINSLNNVDINNNLNIFVLNSNLNTEIQQFARYFSSFKDNNYILINNGSEYEKEIITLYKTNLQNEFSKKYGNETLPLKEILYSQSGLSGVENNLHKEKLNIIIMPSANQIFVINMLTKLQPLSKKFKIILLGMPSWKKFDNNIETEYLYNLNMCSFVPFYIDYNSQKAKDFIKIYRNYYNCEPSKFSFLGYDTGIYFLSALKNYGKNFQDCISNIKVEQLQSFFNFNKTSKDGGYENNGTFIIRYNNENNVQIENIITNELILPLTAPDIQLRKVIQN